MRSIDAEWGEDELIDLGGDYTYTVKYGNFSKQVKCKHDPKDRFGCYKHILKHFAFFDGKVEAFYENDLKAFFWYNGGKLHNPYGAAMVIYRPCGNMAIDWALEDKQHSPRKDKISAISGIFRQGERRIFVTLQGIAINRHFFVKEDDNNSKYYLKVYDELLDEYKKH